MKLTEHLSVDATEITEADLLPLLDKRVMVHVVDHPSQIKNTDDTTVGVVQGFHLVAPTARRSGSGDGTLKLDTFTPRWTRHQVVTIHLVEED